MSGVPVGWPGWCALAGAIAITTVPSPVAGRTAALADRGRLAPSRPGRRIVASSIPLRPALVIGAAGLVAFVAVRVGAVLAVATAAGLATVALFGRDAVARRRADRRHSALLTSLRVLVGELEAGAQPSGALAAAAAAGGASATVFAAAAEVVRQGADPSSVLASGGKELRPLGAAWQASEASGAAPAAVLDRVARDVAAADERRRAVAVALAGPRSSASVLSLLPLVGIALGAAMDAHPLAFLVGEPSGRLLGCAGVLLDIVGLLWIRALVRRAER